MDPKKCPEMFDIGDLIGDVTDVVNGFGVKKEAYESFLILEIFLSIISLFLIFSSFSSIDELEESDSLLLFFGTFFLVSG